MERATAERPTVVASLFVEQLDRRLPSVDDHSRDGDDAVCGQLRVVLPRIILRHSYPCLMLALHSGQILEFDNQELRCKPLRPPPAAGSANN